MKINLEPILIAFCKVKGIYPSKQSIYEWLERSVSYNWQLGSGQFFVYDDKGDAYFYNCDISNLEELAFKVLELEGVKYDINDFIDEVE